MQCQDQRLSLVNFSTATPIIVSKNDCGKRVGMPQVDCTWSFHRATIFNAVARCTGGCLLLITGPKVYCCMADNRKNICLYIKSKEYENFEAN